MLWLPGDVVANWRHGGPWIYGDELETWWLTGDVVAN